MRYNLKLDTREVEKRKSGHPAAVFLFNKGKQAKVALGLNFEKGEWNFEKEEPKSDKKKIIFIREKKLMLDKLMLLCLDDTSIDFNFIKSRLKSKSTNKSVTIDKPSFYEFSEKLIKTLSNKKDSKGVKKLGNVRAYENAINQLKIFRVKVNFDDIDYNFLHEFILWQQAKENKKTTIGTYLKIYKAIYNEAVRSKAIQDKEPFKDISKIVSIKKNRTKKRHTSKDVIRILEKINGLPLGQQTAVDLWLLQFYLGGQDFKDIYYLENKQISKGRLYLTRGKLDEDSYEFDLKIFDKIQKIIDKYKQDGRFTFPWRKDYAGYTSFLRRVQRNLIIVQKKYNKQFDDNDQSSQRIEVLPMRGNFSPKVSRHSFATIGRRIFVEPDLLRSLMGHERNDVDTIYKDSFLEDDRDYWHWEIIKT